MELFCSGFEKRAVSIGWIKNKIKSGAAARVAKHRKSYTFLNNVNKSRKEIMNAEKKLPAHVKKEVQAVKPDDHKYLDYSPEARSHLRNLVSNINKNYKP